MSEFLLPDEAKSAVWRIFGAGAQPTTKLLPYDLIVGVVNEQVPEVHRDSSISVIRSWFEPIGNREYLKQEVQEQVAELILDGVGKTLSDRPIWAVGFFDCDLIEPIIFSRWSKSKIDSFSDAVISLLERVSKLDAILNVASMIPLSYTGSWKARVSRDSFWKRGMLSTFQHLYHREFEMIDRALHRPTQNLIKLVVNLRPKQFENLITKLHHPVMQACAARHVIRNTRYDNHHEPLQWISPNSCDPLIALSIFHTLETVEQLDDDVRMYVRFGPEHTHWRTKLRPPLDDLHAEAKNLVTNLVKRIAQLEERDSARWIGELLSGAGHSLRQHNNQQSTRSQTLETICTKTLKRLLCGNHSDETLESFCNGLRLSSRATWTRHLAEVSWILRSVNPKCAKTLARTVLSEFDEWIAQQLEIEQLFFYWNDWQDRDWIAGLAVSYVLFYDKHNLVEWVTDRSSQLPVSIWDAEENRKTFMTANKAVQIFFLIAFQSIEYLKEIERPVKRTEILALANLLWNHCYFADPYVPDKSDVSVVVEYAARTVIEHGEPSGRWFLEQARSPKVCPRALWALIDQLKQKVAREQPPSVDYRLGVDMAEFTRLASDRFEDGGRYCYDSLCYWGYLWLLLGAETEALLTAELFLKYPKGLRNRHIEILVLELFCLSRNIDRFDRSREDLVHSMYRDLWPSQDNTPDGEIEDRQRIDKLLEPKVD